MRTPRLISCRFCGQDVPDLGEHWKLGGDCEAVAAALNPVRYRTQELVCETCGAKGQASGVTARWHKCTICRRAYWRARWRERYYQGERSDRDALGHRR